MADPSITTAAQSAAEGAGYAVGGVSGIGLLAWAARRFLRQLSNDKTATALDDAAQTNYKHLQDEITRLNALVRELGAKVENQQKEIESLRRETHARDYKLIRAASFATIAQQSTELLCKCPSHIKAKTLAPLNDIIDLAEGTDEPGVDDIHG